MLIIPRRKRKERLSCFDISDEIVAAWPEPMPGRNEQNGAIIEAVIADFRICFLSSLICFNLRIFCFWIFVDLFFKETINAEDPNKPVSNGRSGSFIGRLNVKMPRKPVRENIIRDKKKLSSLKIRKREIKIRMNGIIEAIKF